MIDGRSRPTGGLAAFGLGLLLAGGLAGCPKSVPVTVGTAPAVQVPLDARARAILDAGAADLDVSVRREALALLVASDPEPGGGAAGRRGRYDPNPYVQRAVVGALAARVDDASTALLASLASDPLVEGYTRGEAATAWLARVPTAQAQIAALAAAEPRADRAAGLLLAAVADDAARARLLRFLAEGDLPLEAGFVRRVGASPAEGVREALARVMDRVEPELRLLVAGALLGPSPAAATPPIRAALRGADPDARMEALDVIEPADSPAARTLLSEARGAADRLIRVRAALALAGAGAAPAARIPDGLEDEERELRLAALRAARALRRLDPAALPPRAAERIRALARAADPAEQIEAIRALDCVADPADRAVCLALLDDESLRVRVYTVGALGGR